MTDTRLMNREELLKLAALDVYGLLDEYEAELFNRSFHESSANVQDEIVAIQAAIAEDTTLSPREEPAEELRGKVLARVKEAIEREAEHLAPIPIYSRRKARLEHQRRAHKRIETAARWWRAASFVMAATIVILVVLFMQAVQHGEEISGIAKQLAASNLVNDLIPDYKTFANNPNVVSVNLVAEGRSDREAAQVYVNTITNEVLVMAYGFDKTETEDYELVIRDPASGEITERIGSFDSNGLVACVKFDGLAELAAATISALQWEIVEAASDRTIVRA